MFATAYQVLLPSLVTAGDLVEGNAKLQGSASVAAIGGRSAAGLAAEAVGAATALLFNAASFLVSAACLLRIRACVTPHRRDERATTVRAEIAQGLGFIAGDPYLRPLTLYAAAANLAYAGSTALLVVFLVRVAGFGSAATGLLLGTASVGGVLGAVDHPAAGPPAGHRPDPAAECPGCRAVQPADPADRHGAAGGLLRGGLGSGVGRDSGRGTSSPGASGRPTAPQPCSGASPPPCACCRLRHHPASARCSPGPGHRARHPQRAVGHHGWLRPVRHAPAHPAILSHTDLPSSTAAAGERTRRTANAGHNLGHRGSDGTRRTESFL